MGIRGHVGSPLIKNRITFFIYAIRKATAAHATNQYFDEQVYKH